MTRMEEIEQLAREVSEARHCLADEISKADQALQAIREMQLVKIAGAAGLFDELASRLLAAVEDSPDLFKSPQSMEIAGVKVGWRKGKGRLEYADEAKLVERMRDKLTPAQLKATLKVKTTVLKGQLAKLAGETLKALGVNVKAAGNEAFVSYPKTDVEKRVVWWLAGDKEA